MGRPPTGDQLQQAIEDRVETEVLYREALILGLDKDDAQVRDRLIEKMRQFAETKSVQREPSSAELNELYEQNLDMFTVPGRISFRHLFYSPEKRLQSAKSDAMEALAKIAKEPADSQLAASSADEFPSRDYFRDVAPNDLRVSFGPQFAESLAKLKPGSWQGPIESSMGWHLVFIESYAPGRALSLADVKPELEAMSVARQAPNAWREFCEQLRSKYEVHVSDVPSASTMPTRANN